MSFTSSWVISFFFSFLLIIRAVDGCIIDCWMSQFHWDRTYFSLSNQNYLIWLFESYNSNRMDNDDPKHLHCEEEKEEEKMCQNVNNLKSLHFDRILIGFWFNSIVWTNFNPKRQQLFITAQREAFFFFGVCLSQKSIPKVTQFPYTIYLIHVWDECKHIVFHTSMIY